MGKPAPGSSLGAAVLRSALRAAAMPVLLLALVSGFWWKLTLTDQYTWLNGPDLVNQVLPWFQFQAGALQAGELPLWDPHHWFGQPVLGQVQTGAAYPLNWVLFLLPLQDGWLRHTYLIWYFVAIHAMAAWFAYWLCRDLGRSRLAAVFGGLLYSCAGFLGTNDWPQMLNGAVWIPLVFLFLLRAQREGVEPHWAAASGMTLGFAWLSGHHQIPTFTTLACGGVWGYAWWVKRGSRSKVAVTCAVWAAAMTLTSGLQTVPAYEYGKLAVRWVGMEEPVGWGDKVPYSVHGMFGLGLRSVFGLVMPEVWRNSVPYIGVTAAALALIGIGAFWRDWRVRLFAAVSAGALAVALGGNSVFHGMAYGIVPLVEKARSPSMAVAIFHAGVSVAAAFGMDALRDPGARGWVRRIAAGVAVACGAWYLILLGILIANPAAYHDERLALPVVAGLPLAAILWAASGGRMLPATAGVLGTGLLLLEAGNVGGYNLPNRLDPNVKSLLAEMAEDGDIAMFLRRQEGVFRVYVDSEAIGYNFGDWHGIEMANGYLASMTANVRSQDTFTERAARLLNVRYSVGKAPTHAGQREVFVGRSGKKVYENPDTLPRAWTVHAAAGLENADTIREFLKDADARREAAVRGAAPALESCEGEDKVTIERRGINWLEMEAEMGCKGLLIVSDTYYPGWVATVDGERRPLLEVNGMMRGVVVEGGRRRVAMRYRPLTAAAGAAMTVCGVVLTLGWCWMALRRRRD